MRLFYLAFVLFVMYISIGIVDNMLQSNLTPDASVDTKSPNFLYQMFIQPNIWNLSGVSGFSMLMSIFVGIGAVAVGIAVTATVFGKSDIAMLAIPAGVLLSLGAMPIVSIWSFLTRNVASMACNVGTECLPASLVGALFAGTLGVLWAFTVIEFWLWRPLTQ
jgi:hypothetical protein